MQDNKFEILMLSLPSSLNEVIRDMAYNTPSQNYSRVIESIKNYTPVCGGINCRYKIQLNGAGVDVIPIPLLHRQTHALCSVHNCNNCVSMYEHRVCFRHANVVDFSREYEYFHNMCNRNF